ncbi:(d)CMP kinase [Mobiluncus mulieris]|uniref:Cytidylate kinase n=1 Tax=Mobiluncus mulieris TaxID=2052 RepID=A0A378PEP9_9ACTO|nr:(d)CMP kinase [Mobiluncus mulieris]MCU9969223.1 (d)CMP kinase [Mobiluncus mulieris]MCU9973605.1 (d)CMP kinase [Mobiluncus mulieris]MCV0009245.1 (d)CMP kinase [Mobiluncus mulieris]NMW64631.1 (d)CMP kinase [Mobiluncus mulieris]NMW74205.1 (d)CMP kinase [Mobiluncus mulieris]
MEYEKYENLREKVLGRGLVVAIDGPSGSGKSTIARKVAAALDLGYLDTGAMYRATAWWVDHRGLDVSRPEELAVAVAKMDLKVTAVAHNPRFFVDGLDVGHVIRGEHIDSIVSGVAAVPAVRAVLIALQQRVIREARNSTRGIVVEGRDITTVVAPQAPVRILLTADPEIRLLRRALQDTGHDGAEALERERALVLGRDMKDAKVNEFMQAAPGVHLVDSTSLDLEQTLDAVMSLIDQNTDWDRPGN